MVPAIKLLFLFLSITLSSGSFIDPTTPSDAQSTTPLFNDDEAKHHPSPHTNANQSSPLPPPPTTSPIYTLTMSDEFNTPNRTFKDGDDPTWTAIHKNGGFEHFVLFFSFLFYCLTLIQSPSQSPSPSPSPSPSLLRLHKRSHAVLHRLLSLNLLRPPHNKNRLWRNFLQGLRRRQQKILHGEEVLHLGDGSVLEQVLLHGGDYGSQCQVAWEE